MKSTLKSILLIAVLSFSSAAFADGYRCEGQGYRVKLYDEVQPANGTRNPAIMILSQRGAGTLAVLDASKIVKSNEDDSVVYEGETNSKRDGRFVSAELLVERASRQVDGKEIHSGNLTYNSNGDTIEISVDCERYLKSDR